LKKRLNISVFCYADVMNRYGIATLLDSYPNNYEFTVDNTPLHLTHVDVLEIDLNSEEFINTMRPYLADQTQFSVTPIRDALFGPKKDIPVTLIELSPELKAFHENLIHFLRAEGALFENPHFLEDQYGPHVSIYGSRRVVIGQPIIINDISIGNKRSDIENPPNRIIATIPLI
jgi:hypothetical protein